MLIARSGAAALTLWNLRSERTFVVQEYLLDAAALPMSIEAFRMMGAAIAGLHAASAQLAGTEPAVAALPKFDAFRCARRAAWRTLRQGHLRMPRYLGLLRQVERLRRAAYRADYRCDPLVVHGDVNPMNFIAMPDQQVLIVDFDNACRDNPVHDIARGLAHLGLFSNPDSGTRRFPTEAPAVREQAVASFLDGYAAESGQPVPVAWNALGHTVQAVGIELICLGLLNGWLKPGGVQQWLSQVKRLATIATAEASTA